MLSENYGFSTTVILDANAQDILSTLNDLREEVGTEDNVLIYFAGHGQLQQAAADRTQLGYWLPSNAQRDRTTFWLPNSQINEQLALLPARSVLVIADSCYAGAMSTDPASLLQSGGGELSERVIELGMQRRARYILSSGGLHPVLDTGEGKHSVFANAMIEVLESGQEILREQDLFRRISDSVAERAERLGFEQRPELRPIRAAGHEPGGSFFFVWRQAAEVASTSASFLGADVRPVQESWQ
ncbi:MAG: caspase family protein [Gammaproteobacteria bacterium]|nr:caspase family protein [Gammaproteobacteria bacterium]